MYIKKFFFESVLIRRQRELLKLEPKIATIMFLGAFILIIGTGCSTTYDINVSMSPSMRTTGGIYPTYEVDIVGINSVTEPRFAAYTTEEYFQAGNPFRANAEKYTMYFSDDSQGPFVLNHDDPIWDKWLSHGITKLAVIANLPGIWKVKAGAADGRRLILPLDPDRWPNGRKININVNPSGLVLMSPLTPPGKKKKSWWHFW